MASQISRRSMMLRNSLFSGSKLLSSGKFSYRAFATARLDGTVRGPANAAEFDPRVFQVSEEVQEAVSSQRPTVALETTIYTHGFPYPDNLALASHLESVVRLNGGVPATIGVLNGIARVGMTPEEIIELASAAGKPDTMKVSRRDLSYIAGLGLAGRKLFGGTTISGTMILAKMAGIDIFGTGGLGGVHRGAQDSMDISADLTELGRTRVAVIGSGCKAFLDIPRTLEYLETQGAYVGTFADGRTGNVDMPAFWSRDSGIKSPTVVQDEKEAAAIIYSQGLLGIESGLLFANPIPEEHSIPGSEINGAIEEAVREAAEKGFHGHRNTPFILNKIKELTGGKSIPANRALITSNVTRATKVAVELSKLRTSAPSVDQPSTFMPAISSKSIASNFPTKPESIEVKSKPIPIDQHKIDVLVAGSIAVDLSCDYIAPSNTNESSPLSYTSNPACIQQSVGGVGHNVAYAAHLVSDTDTVRLCSYVAEDLAGSLILTSLKERGVDTRGIMTPKQSPSRGEAQLPIRTAQYVAVNDSKKDLVLAMADMDIIGNPHADHTQLFNTLETTQPKWVVLDANWHSSFIRRLSHHAKKGNAKIAFEPVSVAKSARLFPSPSELQTFDPTLTGSSPAPPQLDLAAPNEHELAGMHDAAKAHGYLDAPHWWSTIDALGIPSTGARVALTALTTAALVDRGVPQRAIQLLPFIPALVTKLGSAGVLVARLLPPSHPLLTAPAAAPFILARSTSAHPGVGGLYMRLYPAAESLPADAVVSVNGVGDTFLGVLVAGLAKGWPLEERLIGIAQRAAVLTLKSRESVSPAVRSLAPELRL
ncbi:MAG: hypothetical protein M1818_004994 [Claussenomyces sp. TS43310]|nr:MAG: hypothetical protein M1818_004994 [Claussenomyces sp. TS43310]